MGVLLLKKLLFWRVPACCHPFLSQSQNTLVIAEMERDDRCSPNRCKSDNYDSAVAPAKMLMPILPARIEQGNGLASLRIDRAHFIRFVTVTNRAGKPQIVFIVCPAEHYGNDVINLKWLQNIVLMALAVAAGVPRCLAHAANNMNRDISACHLGMHWWEQTALHGNFQTFRFP